MQILTERLVIRHFTQNDYADFAELIRNTMAGEYSICDVQWPTDDEGIQNLLFSHIHETSFTLCKWFAVELKSQSKVIGSLLIRPYSYLDDKLGVQTDNTTQCLSWTSNSDYQGSGYMHEALQALMDYCQKESSTKRFRVEVIDLNIPSVKLTEKLGFVKIHSFEETFIDGGEELEGTVYEKVL